MAAEGGAVERIEAGASRAVDASLKSLGSATEAAVREHEQRAAGALDNATLQYLKGKDGKTLSAEELALLHYLQSGGEGLPGDDQLTPRLEAAEKVLGLLAETDMLVVPTHGYDIKLAKLSKDEDRKIRLDSYNMGRPHHAARDGRPFTNVYVRLAGVGYLQPFNLIGRDDLATPLETAEEVDDLFKRQREAIIDPHALEDGAYFPVIAGSLAVSRFAVNLGTRVPLKDQKPDSPRSTRSFYGFARMLTEVDAELGNDAIEEVRERKPKAVEMIKAALREEMDESFEELFEDDDEDWALGQIRKWFENGDVQLFYADEELGRIRGELVDTFRTKLEARTKERTAAVAKGLEG